MKWHGVSYKHTSKRAAGAMVTSQLSFYEAQIKQQPNSQRITRHSLLYPWYVASQSQGDSVHVTAQDKKHLDQKKH